MFMVASLCLVLLMLVLELLAEQVQVRVEGDDAELFVQQAQHTVLEDPVAGVAVHRREGVV